MSRQEGPSGSRDRSLVDGSTQRWVPPQNREQEGWRHSGTGGLDLQWAEDPNLMWKEKQSAKGSVQLETQAQAHCCLLLVAFKQCSDLEQWADLLLRKTQKSIFYLLFGVLFNVAEFIYFLTWAIHQRPYYKYYFRKFFLRIAHYMVFPFTYKKWEREGLGALRVPYIIIVSLWIYTEYIYIVSLQ